MVLPSQICKTEAIDHLRGFTQDSSIGFNIFFIRKMTVQFSLLVDTTLYVHAVSRGSKEGYSYVMLMTKVDGWKTWSSMTAVTSAFGGKLGWV